MRISSQYKLLKHTPCNNTHDYINLFLGKYYKFSLMMFFMVTWFTSEILQGLGKMRVWNYMHSIEHQSVKDVSCNIIGFSWFVWKKCSLKCFIAIMKIFVLVEAETCLFSNYIEIKMEKVKHVWLVLEMHLALVIFDNIIFWWCLLIERPSQCLFSGLELSWSIR